MSTSRKKLVLTLPAIASLWVLSDCVGSGSSPENPAANATRLKGNALEPSGDPIPNGANDPGKGTKDPVISCIAAEDAESIHYASCDGAEDTFLFFDFQGSSLLQPESLKVDVYEQGQLSDQLRNPIISRSADGAIEKIAFAKPGDTSGSEYLSFKDMDLKAYLPNLGDGTMPSKTAFGGSVAMRCRGLSTGNAQSCTVSRHELMDSESVLNIFPTSGAGGVLVPWSQGDASSAWGWASQAIQARPFIYGTRFASDNGTTIQQDENCDQRIEKDLGLAIRYLTQDSKPFGSLELLNATLADAQQKCTELGQSLEAREHILDEHSHRDDGYKLKSAVLSAAPFEPAPSQSDSSVDYSCAIKMMGDIYEPVDPAASGGASDCVPRSTGATTSYGTTTPRLSDAARNPDGSIHYMSQVEAIAYCSSTGSHLPNFRELALFDQTLGAIGMVSSSGDGVEFLSGQKPDGTVDSFYFNTEGYRRPSGDLGTLWFWSSSTLPKDPNYAQFLSGIDGRFYIDSVGNSRAVRCALNN